MVSATLLQECLQDSPKFRAQLAQDENQIEILEQKLEKVLKACGAMLDSGKTFVTHNTHFTNSLWDLSSCFQDSPETASSLNRMIQGLQEMNKFQSILLDQASRTILKNLTVFIKDDIKKVWDSRQHFDKISGELDIALSRHSQVPKSKQAEIEQTNGILQATQTCFRHTVLDHVYYVSMLQARKKHEVLGTLLSYMQACNTYFHQGSDLCEGIQSFLRGLDEQIVLMRAETSKLEKTLGERHTLVTSDKGSSDTIEGYLFKRTTNAFKTWHRRWFCIKDTQLVYRKRHGKHFGEDHYTVMVEDLKLCSVRPSADSERRFCFEVISPNRSHMLQADSEEMYSSWISALQQGIGNALQVVFQNPDSKQKSSPVDQSNNNERTKIWEQLVKIPGNEYCCDCKHPEPRWASINLGITLCIDCSGVHRSLGVHYSKVRSLTLDAWEPEILKVMAELGNTVVNHIYEGNVPEDVIRPNSSSSGATRETFIKRKWVNREFVAGLSLSPLRCNKKWSVRKFRRRLRSGEGKVPPPGLALVGEELNSAPLSDCIEISSGEDSTESEDSSTVSEEDISKLSPTLLLYKASAAHNIPVMLQAMALGADKLWVNPEQESMGHLHQAINSGSVMACEYLLLNGVSINAQDKNGRTALHHAVERGHTAQVCLLLKHRANQHIKDAQGIEPLDIAVSIAHADIVTLLRLGRLNEEMKESDAGTGDDMFNDIVRDFSQLAYTPPVRCNESSNGGG